MATYYVSTTGNDGADGSEGAPWRYINSSVARLLPGDTLFCRQGEYHEVVYISVSGTAQDPITITSYPGEQATLDGRAGVGSANAGLPGGPMTYPNPASKNFPDYQGWPVNTLGYTYSAMVEISGSFIIWDNIDITRSLGKAFNIVPIADHIDGIQILNSTFSYFRWLWILVQGWSDANWTAYDCRNFLIKNCIFTEGGLVGPYARWHTPPGYDWPGGIATLGIKDSVIDGCSFSHFWGEALWIQGNSPKWVGGVYVQAQRNVVKNCIVFDNWRMGIGSMSSVDTVFDSNIAYATGTWSGGIRQTGFQFIGNEPNPLYGDVGMTRGTMINNIGIGNDINIHWNAYDRGMVDMRFINNTSINGTSAGAGTWGDPGNWAGDNRFQNNLLIQDNPSIPLIYGSTNLNNTWTISHNSYNRPVNLSFFSSPFDVIGDPLLTNHTVSVVGGVDPNNYKLLNGSPVIGKALESVAPDLDFFGASRVDADMGFHEYGTSTATIQAAFTGVPLTGDSPLEVQFTDSSTATNGILSWVWSFGDGEVSALQNPIHTYSAPGVYTVTLTVTGNDTQVDTETKVGYIDVTDPDPGTGTGASVLFRHGEFTAKGATGTQVIAHGLGKIPKAIQFYMSGTTGDELQANSRGGMGVTDGVNQWAVTTIEKDGQDPTFSGSYHTEDFCVMFIGDYEGQEWGAVLDSWNSQTFTLNWLGETPAQWKIRFTAIGGDDVTAQAITYDSDYGANWATKDVTTQVELGSQPDLVFGCSVAHSADFWAGNSMLSYGVAANAQLAKTAAQWTWTQQASPSTFGIEAVARNTLGSWRDNWELALGYFATGITLTPKLNDLNGPYHLLCLNIANTQLWLDFVDSPVAIGETSYTDPNFTPQALIGFPLAVTAEDVYEYDQDAGTNGIYLLDKDGNEFSNAEGGEDETWPSVQKGQTTADLTVLNGANTLHKGAGSLESEGWLWDMSVVDSTPRKWLILAIEDATSPEAKFSLNTLTGAYGQTVFQVDDLSNAHGQDPTYSYDWGDLTPPDTDAEPSHVYAEAGTYTVEQSVTIAGVTSTYEIDVTVTAPLPVADFVVTVDGEESAQILAGEVTTFTDASIPGGNETVNTWSWEIYTGNNISGNKVVLKTSTSESFTHTFSSSHEAVSVSLTVTQTGDGTHSDTLVESDLLTVSVAAVISFSLEALGDAVLEDEKVTGVQPVSVSFIDSSQLHGLTPTRYFYEVLDENGEIIETISGKPTVAVWVFENVGIFTVRYSVDIDGSRFYETKLDSVIVNPGRRHAIGPPMPGEVSAQTKNTVPFSDTDDRYVHTHATESTTVGEPSTLVATDEQGGLELRWLGIGTTSPNDEERNKTIRLKVGGHLKTDTVASLNPDFDLKSKSNFVPDQNYAQNLGSPLNKWGELHAAALLVETLISQETIATVGGRLIVGFSSELVSQCGATNTYIISKHNNYGNDDFLWFEKDGNFEVMQAGGDPTYVEGPGAPGIDLGEGESGYYTPVRRAQEGVASYWPRGTAFANTGGNRPGWDSYGFIDLYARSSMRTESGFDTGATGPTIVGNVRHDNEDPVGWGPVWAIGNMQSLYGKPDTTARWGVGLGQYVLGTYILIDSIDGMQFLASGDEVMTIDPSRGILIVSDGTGQHNERRRISFTDLAGTEYGYISLLAGSGNTLNIEQKSLDKDGIIAIQSNASDNRTSRVLIRASHEGQTHGAIEIISDSGAPASIQLNTAQQNGVNESRIMFLNLPTTDPGIDGVVWRSGTDLKVSIG